MKIITDNGKQFVSRQIEDFFKSLGIEHARTALYHPQANRAVERFNRFLTDQLRLAQVENKPVDNAIFIALSMYRSTRHCTTQKSPAELMCGRTMTMPLDRLRKLTPPKAVSFQLDNNVRRSQKRNERNYNSRKRATDFKVKEGRSVRVRDNVCSNKYKPMWMEPRRVTERINDSTVRLDNGTVRIAADLVPAHPPTPESPKPPQPLPPEADKQPPAEPAAGEPPVLSSSNRERKPPAWHAEYSIPKPINKH